MTKTRLPTAMAGLEIRTVNAARESDVRVVIEGAAAAMNGVGINVSRAAGPALACVCVTGFRRECWAA
jgi:hypothetical protein